jgi:Sulfotransferase domain
MPAVIIAGSMKSGTSALSEILLRNPYLQTTKASKGEAHFFDEDPVFLQSADNLGEPSTLCKVQRQYSTYWKEHKRYNQTLYMEKTPRYMMLTETPQHIVKVCRWKPKIVMLLRDPVSRLVSHHKMNNERLRGTYGVPLEGAIQMELERLHRAGLRSHTHSD